MPSRTTSRQNSTSHWSTISRPRRTPQWPLPPPWKSGRLSNGNMTRAWLTYVRRHAPSFSVESRPNVSAVCKETTMARMLLSQSSTTSCKASSVRTCAEKLPNHLRRKPQRRHNRSGNHRPVSRGLSPFLFRCSEADHGTAVLPVLSHLARSRAPHSLHRRRHPPLAISPRFAMTQLHSMPHPDSHPPLRHPQLPSPQFRAHLHPNPPHRTVPLIQRIPRWIGATKNTEQPSKGGKRK
jgi:hypothetical protein